MNIIQYNIIRITNKNKLKDDKNTIYFIRRGNYKLYSVRVN